MTMGPAPMIMIEAMSVRFGIQGSGRAPRRARGTRWLAGGPARYSDGRAEGNMR
jgi:hypothetical protein